MTKRIETLQHRTLLELLTYDPTTGNFTWLVTKSRSAKSGQIAGSLEGRGYWTIMINRRYYKAHRLAWFYMTGVWPDEEMDHINMNKLDNRFENIRPVTRAQNQWNREVRKDTQSGIKGVQFSKQKNKWHVCIKANGKRIHVGFFASLEDARFAREQASNKYHGEYKRI